ncbi:MAG: hypothetical protein LBV08_11420 [Clostridiales bacterium]|jgi:hypothetical protein|nr:hypothetical protein [Clostridiales bacterium]
MFEKHLIENILKYVGQTVTIFTESGGLSGSGFTGLLAGVSDDTVKVITCIGSPPSCPVGSACNFCNRCRGGINTKPRAVCQPGNFLGSVTEIPLSKIVAFTHNAI